MRKIVKKGEYMKTVFTCTSIYYKEYSSIIPSTSVVVAESEEKLMELMSDIAKEMNKDQLNQLFEEGRVMYDHECIDIVREISTNFLHV